MAQSCCFQDIPHNRLAHNTAVLLMIFVYLLALQPVQPGGSDVSTNRTLRVPNTIDSDPIAPVNYQFGEDLICPVLTTSSTAVVVQCNVTNTSQVFMVDLPQNVPIELGQKTGPRERCHSLIIRALSSDLLEGEFKAFYDGKESRICYGPLGLFNPVGGNLLPFNPSNVYRIHYRTLMQEEFIICRNGSIANFQVSVSPLAQCVSGSNGGGFSTPFELTIVYGGSESTIGQNFTITSSRSCEDPSSGITFTFTISDPSTTMPTTTTPTPALPVTSALPVTPTNSIGTTPPTSNSTTDAPSLPSSNTVPIAVSVTVTVGIILTVIIIVWITVRYKFKRKYKVKKKTDVKASNGAIPLSHRSVAHQNSNHEHDSLHHSHNSMSLVTTRLTEPDTSNLDPKPKSPAQPWLAPTATMESAHLESVNPDERIENHDDHDGLSRQPGSSVGEQQPDGNNMENMMMHRIGKLEEEVGSRLDVMEQNTSNRLDAMEKKTSDRLDAMEQTTGDRLDAMEKKTGDRFDMMEQKTDDRIAAMERKSGDRLDALEQRTGDKLDTMEQRTGDRLDAMEQRIGDQFAAMERKTGDRLDAMEQKTGDRFDAVDSRLDAMKHTSSMRNKNTDQKLNYIIDDLSMKDIPPQDFGEYLMETRQCSQQPNHVLDQNNNQEACSLGHTTEINQQKEFKTTTQLKGIITSTVSSQTLSNGHVVTSTQKDNHKSEK